MKAWIVADTKAEHPLRWVEVPDPVPEPGRSVVKVEAAAVNFSDLLMVRGRYQVRPPPPFTPGQEVAGSIVAPAPGSAFKSGERVASKVVWGGFAEKALVADDMAIAVPDGMPLAEAASLPVVYVTAHLALLTHARLAAGETVLVHAAAGALGLAAVEIARAKGARVIATVGDVVKAGVARERGAEDVLDYGDPAWVDRLNAATGGRGADVIFDSVGGDVTAQSLKCIAWGGRLLVVGFSSGNVPAIPANRLLLRNAAAIGVYWDHARDAARIGAAVRDLFALHASGGIRPRVDTRFRLEELPRALEELQSRRTTGKIVLRVGGGG